MPKPVLQALVLADHVYQDKTTGKMVIAGTFNRLHVFRRDGSQRRCAGAGTDTGNRAMAYAS